MVSLLALGRAAAEEAQRWYQFRFAAHLGTLGFAILGVLLPAACEYYLVVLALVSEGLARWFHHRALHWHSLSRETKRFAVMKEGLGHDPTSALEVRSQFNAGMTARAEAIRDAGYYSSTQPVGTERLREVLRESSFFMHYLYQAAARAALARWVIVLAITVGAALMVIPAVTPFWSGQPFQVARLFVILLAFLPASEEFDHMLLWYAAARETAALKHLLESPDASRMETLMLALASYSATTTAAPPVRTWLYDKEREHLEALWNSQNAPVSAKVPCILPDDANT